MIGSTDDMLNIIKDVTKQELNSRDQSVICQIAMINSDGTYNVYVLPDTDSMISGIPNSSRFDYEVGDYVYVFKVGNLFANSFIIGGVGKDFKTSSLGGNAQNLNSTSGASPMPIIRLARVTYGAEGTPVSDPLPDPEYKRYNYEEAVSATNPLIFSVEIVGGGNLRVGDELQICKVKLVSGSSSLKKRYKLRQIHEHAVTQNDLDVMNASPSKILTISVDTVDKLRRNESTFLTVPNVKFIRIRRKGGNTQFSNVISFLVRWYQVTGGYKITIH